jgi:hypothetical protein
MNRRTFVTGTAVVLPSGFAGCIGTNDTRPDPGDISIDGRIHNETDATHTFDVLAETEEGYTLIDEAYEVPGGGTERIAGIGVLGATQTFTIAVDGTDHSETLTLDIEPVDHVVDGYVDIQYTTAGEIDLSVTPRKESGESDSVPELTGYTVSDTVVTPNVERESDMDSWGVFVASQSVATEYFDTGDDENNQLQTFISETSFEEGEGLVYVQAFAPQTCYELVLGEEPSIRTNGLPVVDTELNRTAPDDQACGEAITSVGILVRLSFDPDGPPADVVVVQVTDSDGNQQEGFQVEAEQ